MAQRRRIDGCVCASRRGRGLEGKQCAWKTGAKALRLMKDTLNEDKGSVSPSRSSRLRVS